MTKVAAVSFIYEHFRGLQLQNAIEIRGTFTDAVNADLKLPKQGLAFISLDGQNLNLVMAYNKTGRAATQLDQLRFRRSIELDPAISYSTIEQFLPKHLRSHFRQQVSPGVSKFSPKVYEAFLAYINEANPWLRGEIDRLIAELDGPANLYQGHSAQIAEQEQDAINLALRLGGFAGYDYEDWHQASSAAPFLQGFPEVQLREDAMVIHDSLVFGDWKPIATYVVGATEFAKDGHKLTIMNVNRRPLEETLGVDLLMYHHTYLSYVLIQYKRMIKEGQEWAYRPIDSSYKKEIERMEQFEAKSEVSLARDVNDFRLRDEFFYFKLCKARQKGPLSTKMIGGMYLPFSYWKLLLSSTETTGQRGGRILTYANVSRHINNTQFVDLFQNGWIGSQATNTELIAEQIQASIFRDNSLMLARYEPSAVRR